MHVPTLVDPEQTQSQLLEQQMVGNHPIDPVSVVSPRVSIFYTWDIFRG